MRKHTLILFFIIALLSGMEIHSQEAKQGKPAETEQTNPVLTVEGNVIRIHNTNPKTKLEIYNVLGVKISSIPIETPDKTIVLNLPKGCYIVKIEDIVRKIAIK